MQDIKYVECNKKSPERVPFALLALGGLVPECICMYVAIVTVCCFRVFELSVVFFFSSARCLPSDASPENRRRETKYITFLHVYGFSLDRPIHRYECECSWRCIEVFSQDVRGSVGNLSIV